MTLMMVAHHLPCKKRWRTAVTKWIFSCLEFSARVHDVEHSQQNPNACKPTTRVPSELKLPHHDFPFTYHINFSVLNSEEEEIFGTLAQCTTWLHNRAILRKQIWSCEKTSRTILNGWCNIEEAWKMCRKEISSVGLRLEMNDKWMQINQAICQVCSPDWTHPQVKQRSQLWIDFRIRSWARAGVETRGLLTQ